MLADDLAAEFAAIAEVEAVALGGSRASGSEDHASDIDLYVYSNGTVPVERRSELAHRRGTPVEIDNWYWETGDEWDERESGIHIDVMYRTLRGTHADLSRVLLEHEASIGYTTCVVHNLSNCRVLFDRRGELAALQGFARQPYPEALAEAIIAKNLPLLRDSFGAFGGQIIKAAKRADKVSVNHRTAAFLGSYFDILFAANRATHPGEKRLVQLAAKLPHLPPGLEENVNGLLSAQDPEQLSACIDRLTDGALKVLNNLALD